MVELCKKAKKVSTAMPQGPAQVLQTNGKGGESVEAWGGSGAGNAARRKEQETKEQDKLQGDAAGGARQG